MKRTASPPQEESPEEAGARIIRELLESPDIPQTLEEDLLETSMRMVQEEEIIPLQLALERQKLALRASIATKLEQHFHANPSLTKELRASRHEAARAFEKKQIAALREHTGKLIDALHVTREHRDEAIRAWCRAHATHDGVTEHVGLASS